MPICGKCEHSTLPSDSYCRICGAPISASSASGENIPTAPVSPPVKNSPGNVTVGMQSTQSTELAFPDQMRRTQDANNLRVLLRRIQELEKERNKLKDQLWKARGRSSRLLAWVMLLLGAIALASAVVYTVTVLAFIGLGLTFWGVLLLQVRPAGYLRAELLESTALSPILIANQFLRELGYAGKAIYMIGENEQTVVFVPAEDGEEIPSPNQMRNVFLESPKGVILTPPGRSLAYLLAEELGGKSTIRDLAGDRLAQVLTEHLDIMKGFEMHLEGGRALIRFEESVYANLCNDLKDSTSIWSTIGCPISSAMACLLTQATMRPVVFEGETLSENGRIMEASYHIT